MVRKMYNSVRFFSATVLVGMFLLLFCGCSNKEPIPVGFSAELTGKQAELGVQERNAVQMAVARINNAGGINGRKIELIVRDDLGTADGARNADRELIEKGVVAIIGHATSGQTIAGLSVTNPARVVMLSPTASTAELSGKDDYFLRVLHSLFDRSRGLAQHTYQQRGVKSLAIIYDTNNAAYVQSFRNTFKDKYESLGGRVSGEAEFSSADRTDFDPMLKKLQLTGAKGLLIIASDNDTAMIAQRTRLIGWHASMFTSAWAQTETLIKNGGQAVEGMEFEQTYALNSQSPEFLEFKTNYQQRFGRAPSFGALLGYEAVLVLAHALKQSNGKAEGLKQALLDTREFSGLVDKFSFDKYGDVKRPFYLSAIRGGRFVDIVRVVPESGK
jgi:branched-chain amino acid transport system substrate-binding protein